jgi:glucokinase
MKEYVLAVDLGGTNLRFAAIDGDGKMLYRLKRPTPRNATAAGIVALLIETANECRTKLSAESEAVAFAAAVPGGVDYDRGTVVKAPNLPFLDGFGLGSAMRRALGITVVLENDANAAAVGESWTGASRGFRDSIMLTLGTGVGAGIVIGNRLHRGIDGMAGEVGHVCIEPNGAPCGCGSHGCVEQYTSATAIVRQTRELSGGFPESPLAHAEKMTAGEIYEAGIAGDELARAVFGKMGFYLGLALGGLINTFNPEMVVIGGGASAGWDLFIPHVRAQIAKCAFAKSANRAVIVPAALGDDAGILGAARLGFVEAKLGTESRCSI